MKRLLAVLTLLFALPVAAGGYFGADIDTYDPITGLYYKAVESAPEQGGFLSSKGNGSRVININIFDPVTGQSHLLFDTPQKEGISAVLFETGFKEGSIEFYGASYSTVILNNSGIAKRPPRDKILIGERSNDGFVLFVANKRGEGLKKVALVPKGADWHLDVKNSKLRIVHQTGDGIRIDSYEW